jgi:hypothetical protein
MTRLLTTTTAILIGALATGAEFYVAPDGKDGNPGTKEQPFATVEAARDAAKRGDRIILRGGTYRLNEPLVLGPRNSGVTWMAFQDEKPVLSGGVPVTGWTADANGRFKATVHLDNFRQLWVNGRRAQRARGAVPVGLKFWGKYGRPELTSEERYFDSMRPERRGKYDADVRPEPMPTGKPDEVILDPKFAPGTLMSIGKAGFTTTDASLAGWRNPGDMEFGFHNSWTHSLAKVERIDKAEVGAVIEMSQPGFFLCCNKGGIQEQSRMPAYLENALELLDQPGAWYFDRTAHILYYKPQPGEDINTIEVIAPRLETLILVKGTLADPTRDLSFQGLTFSHATWLRPSTGMGHPDVQANFSQFISNSYYRTEYDFAWITVNGEYVKSPANVVVDAAHGIRFERCTFTALGGAGLDLQHGAQSNAVTGCRFTDISGNGIQVGDVTRDDHHPNDPRRIVKDNRIENNIIYRVGQDYTDSVGVFYGYTEGTVIAHNEIFAIPYSGLSGGWGWGMTDAGGGGGGSAITYKTPTPCRGNRIEFNHIHDVNLLRDDGGCIYTLGRQPGTSIRGNHLHHSVKGHGIYLDAGSGDIEVASNVIYQVRESMRLNNWEQNRLASCSLHDNYGLGLPFKNGCVVEEPIASDPPRFTLSAKILLFQHPSGGDLRRWIVCKGANEWADGNISLFMKGANVSAYLNIGGGKDNVHEIVSTNAPLPLGKWTPVALTYDGDRMVVYCDGKEVGAKKIGKARAPGTAPLTIGQRGDRFKGMAFECGDIDEVRLFNRVLAPKEVEKDGDGLVKRWDLDQATKQGGAPKIIAEAGLEPEYRELLDGEVAREVQGKK